jgi:hypothetical protein
LYLLTQIRRELYEARLKGKSGPIAFDEAGDLVYDPGTAYRVGQFQKDGTLKFKGV